MNNNDMIDAFELFTKWGKSDKEFIISNISDHALNHLIDFVKREKKEEEVNPEFFYPNYVGFSSTAKQETLLQKIKRFANRFSIMKYFL